MRRQSELLHITRSTLYYQVRQPDEEALWEKEQIMAHIDYWHTELPCCGSRKLAKLLQGDGFQVGRNRIRSLMAEMGIQAIYPKKNLSKCTYKAGAVLYLLRNKDIFLPNQAWSIDITYIKLNCSHMYLTAIIDWHSRKLLAWNLSDTLDTAPVLETVKDTVARYEMPAIINSDQGSQFTSIEYKQLLQDLHIRQSMDGKTRWADNIYIERWFRSLKT